MGWGWGFMERHFRAVDRAWKETERGCLQVVCELPVPAPPPPRGTQASENTGHFCWWHKH